ncbi:hypothetical protein [Pedobacter sp. Hv1]|uniref:hypothetical protein n=1 Tax=Pedobacter sp. Hv1 TaxID=1740090 RepID=UPI0006D8AE15|nr:hypothetical protein [Pedobacter sp. Hv1]KQC02250.1 hypothetical protein AQF98_01350 [Pedobacter sp. Hv1]
MKKVLLAFVALFVLNLGCKKISDVDRLCACSPISNVPYLSLVIKNNNGGDLLSATTAGAFAKEQIQLYRKDANGEIKQLEFRLRPPFAYGTNQLFNYSQLVSMEIALSAKSINDTFYLKLGDNQLYELNLKVNEMKIEKLLINQQEAPLENSTTGNAYVGTIFSMKL